MIQLSRPDPNYQMSKGYFRLPRKSVLKAVIGLTLVLGTVLLVLIEYRDFEIFGLIPIVLVGMMTREHLSEIGFKS